MFDPDVTQTIRRADQWLDRDVGEQYQDAWLGQDWARACKIIEEAGEAVAALIGYTGQNPRKGTTHSIADVLEELADCAWSAIFAIQHFTKNTPLTEMYLGMSLDKVARRIPGDIQ